MAFFLPGQRLRRIEYATGSEIAADVQFVDSYVLSAWIDNGQRGRIPNDAVVIESGSTNRVRRIRLPLLPPRIESRLRIGLSTVRRGQQAIEEYGLIDIPRSHAPNPARFAQRVHSTLFRSAPGPFPLYRLGREFSGVGKYPGSTLSGEPFTLRVDRILIDEKAFDATNVAEAPGTTVTPRARDRARNDRFAGVVARVTLIGGKVEQPAIATILSWDAATNSGRQRVSAVGISGDPYYDAPPVVPPLKFPQLRDAVLEDYLLQLKCDGRLVVDAKCRDTAIATYNAAVAVAEAEWKKHLARARAAYEIARDHYDEVIAALRLRRASRIAAAFLACAPAAVAWPAYAACVGGVIARVAALDLSIQIAAQLALDAAKRELERVQAELPRHLLNAVQIAGRALLRALRQCVSCDPGPAPVVFCIRGLLEERTWTNSRLIQNLRFDQCGTVNGYARAIKWKQTDRRGTFEGGASAAFLTRPGLFGDGGAMSTTHSFRLIHKHRGGWPMFIFRGYSGVTVDAYVLGGPGTSYVVQAETRFEQPSGFRSVRLKRSGYTSGTYRGTTTTKTIRVNGAIYSKLRLPSTWSASLFYGNTGPNQRAFTKKFGGDLKARLKITRAPLPRSGDANSDGSVDANDLDFVERHRGRVVSPGTQGDVNWSGNVDEADLAFVRARIR